ncbi:MAG: rod shape-determining protein RodA [Polaribacter sp.]
MRQERNNIFYGIDWILVVLFLILVSFGWLNIYAASKTDANYEILDFSTKYGKQLLWIALSIPLIIGVLFFNAKFYERFSGILYLISLLSLVLLFPLGKEINGATSWFSFGGMNLQPSEFVKTFTALAIAKLLSDRQYNFRFIKNQLKAFAIIFVPALLIALQPDIGSMIIYLSFFFVLNREGLTYNYILLGFGFTLLFILTILFREKWMIIGSFLITSLLVFYSTHRGGKNFLRFNWHKIIAIYVILVIFILGTGYIYDNVFKQHHRDRFEVLLRLKVDHQNVGYNSHQSEITISSGGFAGKGFLEGEITQGKFVPEQHTDYIFSTVAEEWGFVGSTLVIIAFIFLLFRIIYLSDKQTNKFGRIYGYGVASVLLSHIVINIGMVIGLLPTIGIPLPFFSYGGSSLWGFTILLFIFIRLDAHKSYDL